LLKSMTGFGRGNYLGKLKQVTVEIKATNHRFAEVQVKLPRQYTALEERIKREVLQQISRGHLEVFVKLEDAGQPVRELQVDKALALAYYKELKELAEAAGLPCEVRVIDLAVLPEVCQLKEPEENMELIWAELLPALQDALANLLEMRRLEGQKLKEDLVSRVAVLRELRGKIAAKSPLVVRLYRERLATRLQELLEEGAVDETRLAMEVAIFADRANIDEELVRLESHFAQLEQNLQEENQVGRKIDFLLQEINREVNTIGSKANDLEITQTVVQLKSELEKIREQVQNIE
jgi:uncharacterized protein (TIGR00255 family)